MEPFPRYLSLPTIGKDGREKVLPPAHPFIPPTIPSYRKISMPKREKSRADVRAHHTPASFEKGRGPLFHLMQGDVPGGKKEARKRSRPSLFKAGRGDRGLAMLLAAKWSDACFQRGREKGCTCIQYVRAMVFLDAADAISRHVT